MRGKRLELSLKEENFGHWGLSRMPGIRIERSMYLKYHLVVTAVHSELMLKLVGMLHSVPSVIMSASLLPNSTACDVFPSSTTTTTGS